MSTGQFRIVGIRKNGVDQAVNISLVDRRPTVVVLNDLGNFTLISANKECGTSRSQYPKEFARDHDALNTNQQTHQVAVCSTQQLIQAFSRLVWREYCILELMLLDKIFDDRFLLAAAYESETDSIVILEPLGCLQKSVNVVTKTKVSGVHHQKTIFDPPLFSI